MTAAAGDDWQLLDAATAERVRDLELFARERVQGVLQGSNASILKGFTSDFLQHRPYLPGDSLRHLDWRVNKIIPAFIGIRSVNRRGISGFTARAGIGHGFR